MNALSFIELIMMIFGKKLPDLEKIQKKGLLAVKIAQTFALRIDFLDEARCQHLAKLYSHTTPLPSENVDTLLKAYTTPQWRSHFKSINPKPIGSASVGQVHRAELTNGDQVVVKLIKKDFAKTFEKDVKRVLRLLRFVIFFYPKLARVADPIGILEALREMTLAELDLRNEINHGLELQRLLKEKQGTYNISRLAFPKYYPELSNDKVMVSEFIEGPTLDELLEKRAIPYDDILEIYHIHGFYMYAVGTFHGDLHPGNIIYKDHQFYFIDTGALSTASIKMRKGLFRFMANLSKGDFVQCAYSLNEMAAIEIKGAKLDLFVKNMKELYKDFDGKPINEVSLTQKMMETIRMGVNHGMTFEKGMFPIIKSHMYMDGMVLKGNPQAVVMKDVGRFIEEFKDYFDGFGQ